LPKAKQTGLIKVGQGGQAVQSDGSPNVAKAVLQANIEYHDLIADSYENDASATYIFNADVQARIGAIAKWLREHTAGELWIDVGCGTGNVLKFGAQSFKQAIGFDVSAGMLRLAQARGLDARQVADARSLPLDAGVADVASAFSVLHHMHDPKPALAEVFRILKPGGYFYGDLDPNGLCLIRMPLLRATYRRLYKIYLGLFRRVTSVGDQDAKINELQNLAEYHQTQTPGLDPVQTVRDMQAIGFREVRIYLSFGVMDPAWLDRPKSAWPPFGERIMPLFSVLARK
jgi:ubiquinone/menaquinone biosynthesis C-methylase UbiE